MNIHKNARLTLVRRMEMVQGIVKRGLSPAEAAAEAGVSEPTGRKWLGRYLAERIGLARPLLAPETQPSIDQSREGAGHRGTTPPAPDPSAHRPSTGV